MKYYYISDLKLIVNTFKNYLMHLGLWYYQYILLYIGYATDKML